MKNKSSDQSFTQVMREGLSESISPTTLIQKLQQEDLKGYLNRIMGRKGISTDALAELAALNRASLYKILNGTTRHPQRNVLLRLALVLRLDFEKTQELLYKGGRASLSGGRARDIIISDGIINKRSIEEVNERLLAHFFLDLYSKE